MKKVENPGHRVWHGTVLVYFALGRASIPEVNEFEPYMAGAQTRYFKQYSWVYRILATKDTCELTVLEQNRGSVQMSRLCRGDVELGMESYGSKGCGAFGCRLSKFDLEIKCVRIWNIIAHRKLSRGIFSNRIVKHWPSCSIPPESQWNRSTARN